MSSCATDRATKQGKDSRSTITRDQAVQIADTASRKAMDIPPDLKPTVEETDDVFIVTYPLTLPEDTLGPDYYTRVEIDKKTGEIILLLVGS